MTPRNSFVIRHSHSHDVHSKMRKTQYRFNDQRDLVLLREIQSCEPYNAGHGNTTKTWEVITKNCKDSLGTDGDGLTSTLVQSRFKVLVDKFKKKEAISLRNSGVDEEFNENMQLMTDIFDQAGCLYIISFPYITNSYYTYRKLISF